MKFRLDYMDLKALAYNDREVVLNKLFDVKMKKKKKNKRNKLYDMKTLPKSLKKFKAEPNIPRMSDLKRA